MVVVVVIALIGTALWLVAAEPEARQLAAAWLAAADSMSAAVHAETKPNKANLQAIHEKSNIQQPKKLHKSMRGCFALLCFALPCLAVLGFSCRRCCCALSGLREQMDEGTQ